MTLVLLAPIGLGAGSWAWVDDLGGRDAVAVRYPRATRRDDGTVDFVPLPVMADRIAQRLDGPLDVVGMSMGGVLAQHLAARHPGRVRSVFLGCCPATVEREAMASRSRTALSDGMAEMTAQTMPRWFADYDPEHEQRPGVLSVRDTLLAQDPVTFAGLMHAMAGYDLRTLAPITALTTIVGGTTDGAAPAAKARELFELIPGSRLEIVRGGHLPQIDNPAEFSSALRRHLDWVDETIGGPWRADRRAGAPAGFGAARIRPPQDVSAATAELLARIAGHRGRLLHVYDVLSHRGELVQLISDLGRYFIDGSVLPPRLREIGVLRIGANLGAEYEYAQHAMRAQDAELTQSEITGLLRREVGEWKSIEAAVIALANAMTSDAGVDDRTWALLSAELDEQGCLDLVALLGFYVMIALVTSTLQVPLEPGTTGWPPARAMREVSIDTDDRSEE